VSVTGGGSDGVGESLGTAAAVAAEQVAVVRDLPQGRLDLLRASYAPLPGAPPMHLRYRRAALAFMSWQVGRGLLNPLDHERPGSPWWRAVNERLLRDTCEARARLLGHPGPASSPSVAPAVRFAREPSSTTWYRAHNVTVVTAYLDHRALAEREDRVERFFINLVLLRLLYAHALVAAPRLALGWCAPVAPWLGDPRRAGRCPAARGRPRGTCRSSPDGDRRATAPPGRTSRGRAGARPRGRGRTATGAAPG